MPNWCNNTLAIRGDGEQFDNFVKRLEPALAQVNADVDADVLKLFVPEPDPKPLQWDDGNADQGWYNWRVQNWGTKWDLDSPSIDVDDGAVTIEFASAWSPPLEWLAAVAKEFDELEFGITYSECGESFCGYSYFRDGKAIENWVSTNYIGP
jgi:hypothetical protein